MLAEEVHEYENESLGMTENDLHLLWLLVRKSTRVEAKGWKELVACVVSYLNHKKRLSLPYSNS